MKHPSPSIWVSSVTVLAFLTTTVTDPISYKKRIDSFGYKTEGGKNIQKEVFIYLSTLEAQYGTVWKHNMDSIIHILAFGKGETGGVKLLQILRRQKGCSQNQRIL